MIEDKDLTRARLVDEVSKLFADRQRLELMEENAKKSARNNAADVILKEIIELLGEDKMSS